jgi:hypothetical protein
LDVRVVRVDIRLSLENPDARGVVPQRDGVQHPRHRHVQELYLTDEGREVLRRADAVVAEVEETITQQLGRINTARLKALLEKVADTAQKV